MVTLIAAMDQNRLIGTGCGGLPWSDIPRDKQHFREYTLGKNLLIGRRTFEEMQGWFRREGRCQVVNDLDEVFALTSAQDGEEIVVCGGAELYRLTLPVADRLILTLLNGDFPQQQGGVFFPDWKDEGFVEYRREEFEANSKVPFSMTFLYLTRRAGSKNMDC